MSIYTISPGLLSGSITPPPSKSLAHRAIICAALSKGTSYVKGISDSDDMKATLSAVSAMGAICSKEGEDTLCIDGTNVFSEKDLLIDCNESGSTLRFLLPLVLAEENKVRFIGRGQLGARPIDPYYPIFEQNGIRYENHSQGGDLDFRLEGKMKGGKYSLPGNVSSQFITGLLFTLPLLEEDSVLTVTGNLESKAYVDLTLFERGGGYPLY